MLACRPNVLFKINGGLNGGSHVFPALNEVMYIHVIRLDIDVSQSLDQRAHCIVHTEEVRFDSVLCISKNRWSARADSSAISLWLSGYELLFVQRPTQITDFGDGANRHHRLMPFEA